MGDFHREQLKRLCFICGTIYDKCYPLNQYAESISKALYIDISTVSDGSIFPQQFCDKCYYKARNVLKRHKSNS